ncbi:MAG TPA: hypothetical protein VH298_16790 [Jatrophihabitans sp.]|nr:hypothetical protein [Jatrophihabitans sp.]
MSPNLLNRSGDVEQSRRPATVDYAVYALIVRCVFSVLSALVAYGARPEITDAIAKANSNKNWTADQLRHNVDSTLRATVITALLVSVMVLVMAKFLRDGKNWARWLYVVFAILVARDVQQVLGLVQYHNVLLRLTSGLTGLAALAALVLMFLPASNAYLRPADGRSGLFGSMFGPRSTRTARQPEPVAPTETAEPPEAAEPADAGPAVDLAKTDRPVATGQPVGSRTRPAVGPPATRRPPRAKSRRQPTE